MWTIHYYTEVNLSHCFLEKLLDIHRLIFYSRRNREYAYDVDQIGQLERFFDVDNYPPEQAVECPMPPRPPRGRENLPSALWELDDPWYFEPEQRDLIDFDDGRC